MQIKLIDIVDFIWLNRRDKVFIAYQHRIQIAIEVSRAIQENSLLYTTDSSNKITGTLIAEKDDKKKLLIITENLAMNLSNLKAMASMGKAMYPDYKLQWCKRGILKNHNTQKVYNKLATV